MRCRKDDGPQGNLQSRLFVELKIQNAFPFHIWGTEQSSIRALQLLFPGRIRLARRQRPLRLPRLYFLSHASKFTHPNPVSQAGTQEPPESSPVCGQRDISLPFFSSPTPNHSQQTVPRYPSGKLSHILIILPSGHHSPWACPSHFSEHFYSFLKLEFHYL